MWLSSEAKAASYQKPYIVLTCVAALAMANFLIDKQTMLFGDQSYWQRSRLTHTNPTGATWRGSNSSRLEFKVSDINPNHRLAVLHNFCLGHDGTQHVFWLRGMSDAELKETLAAYQSITSASLPALKLMDKQMLVALDDESNSGGVIFERLDHVDNAEYYLMQRQTVNNLFHWLGCGFLLYTYFFDNGHHPENHVNGTVFHIPSLRRFYNLADLSYVEFVQLMGVPEQRTIHGVVHNISDTHVDEWRAEDSNRMTCFPHGIVGVVPKKERISMGSRVFSGTLRLSFEAYLTQFRQFLGVQTPSTPPHCSPHTALKATIITRSKGSAREIVNMDQVLAELQKRHIPYELNDLDGRTFRQQVEFATFNCSLLLAAHGQGLWLTAFLPKTAGVVEILPYGFPYPYYRNIAASHGITNYSQITVDRPWHPATKRMIKVTQSYLRRDAIRNGTAIDNVASELDNVLDLLQPKSYKPVSQYFVSQLGSSQANADVAAKVLAREQPLLVNVTAVVDAIETQYQRLLRDCGINRRNGDTTTWE